MKQGSHSKAPSEGKRGKRHAVPVALLAAVVVAGLVALLAGPAISSRDAGQVLDEQGAASESNGQAQGADTPEGGQTQAAATNAGGEDDPEENPLTEYCVCIDAGHGAHPDQTPSANSPIAAESQDILTEPGGTEGALSGPEYKICLEVALYLQGHLEEHGVNVVQVRTSNDVTISPQDRAEIANGCEADLFVRLHCDSAGSATEGFYTLVPGKAGYQAEDGLYKRSQAMGERMHAFVVDALGAKDRGVTVRTDQGGFNWCMRPAVLFEMANLDNAADDERMSQKSYKKKVAKAIADATADYLLSLAG